MSEFIQHPAFFPGLAVILFLVANLWVFLRREWEGNHKAVDYAQIYYPLDAPSIREWKIKGNRYYPQIRWNKHPSHWQIIHDGEVVETVLGNAPVITFNHPIFTGEAGSTTALDSQQEYTLRPLPVGLGPDIRCTLAPIAKSYYVDRGMSWPTDICRILTDTPCGKFKQYPVSYWIDDYSYAGPAALAETDRIIREKMEITDTDSELTRMDKIIHYMRTQLVEAGGVPKDDFRWKNPFQIFSEMAQGTGKGWCTQNAQIFAFFANRAGVPTRFVSCGTVQSNRIIYDGHSWNESFLKEQNRWVYTDPVKAIVGVFDQKGCALNTADVFHLCQFETFDGITARVFKNWLWKDLPVEADPDTSTMVPFTMVNQTAKNQSTKHTIIKYRRPPNAEDVRHKYSMLFRNWTFAWTNFKCYLYRYNFAYSKMPTAGLRVYRARQSLFAGLILSIVWWACVV